MEEKDLFKRINKESENNVPDAYGKIVLAARAQGLFDGYDGAEAYSDGETVALGGVNKKAIALTSLAAVTAVCLAIALPIALSGTYDGGLGSIDDGNKVVADIDLGDSYAYGAVTCARLAESFFGSTGSETQPVAKTMALHSGTSGYFDEFGTYFSALDCFIGNENIGVTGGKPLKDYQKSVSISGRRANGDLFDYSMYYTEYKIVTENYVQGNPVNYNLEGVISVGGFTGLPMVGERTMSSDASDAAETALNLCVYPNLNDKSTYAQMQLQFEEVDGVTVKSYSYKIVRKDSSVSEAVAYKSGDDGLVIKIKNGETSEGIFSVAGKAEDGQGYKVNYGVGSNSGVFTVNYTDNGLEYEIVENDLLGYRDNGNGTYSVSKYNGDSDVSPEVLLIPATHNGKPVVSIANGTFRAMAFKKVIISEGIKEIEATAFFLNRQLTEVVLPSTLTAIGESAFAYCESLQKIDLPSDLTEIGRSSFLQCINLSAVNFNDKLVSVEASAFQECTSLTSVKLPASLTAISAYAFNLCANLSSITVDEGNPVYYSEGNCVITKETRSVVLGIKNSVIPNNVNSIGNYAFYRVGLTDLELPDGVTYIGVGAFEGNSFTNLVLPDGITKIDKSAFIKCSIQNLTLPSELETIGTSAFQQCTNLKSVHIPAKVTQIGVQAFSGCKDLVELTVDAGNTVYRSADNCIINTTYKTLVAGCKTSVIPADGSVLNIGSHAFESLDLGEIILPSSVQTIQDYAFSCSTLTGITMEGVISIASAAFEDCIRLKTVVVSDKLKDIGDYAFYRCQALAGISLPEGLLTIGSSAFLSCISLEEVVLPSTLTPLEVGSNIFEGCVNLKNAVLSEGVAYVYSKMFYGCEYLETVTIPKTVKNIDFQAFYGCSRLHEINFGGTMAEWEAIEFGDGWNYGVCIVDGYQFTVNCTDGTLAEDGTVIN